MNATHVICCPTSPNDGDHVRVVSDTEHAYDPVIDAYESGWVEVEVISTGHVGWIHKRFLGEIQ